MTGLNEVTLLLRLAAPGPDAGAAACPPRTLKESRVIGTIDEEVRA
ncbi:hypothetical protein [Dactylosporangium darangshiense]|uniref:Uncharacterized protein n=1 Tax=Dactylosporangium darangshiense TaxID=579108 RepID=A0ABP8DI91_9ACTN